MTFKTVSDLEMGKIASDEDVDHLNLSVCDSIFLSIKRKGGKPTRRPWWTMDCDKAEVK